MNIFVLSLCPIEAAQFLCDKHIPKLIVECFQMLGSAQRRHGVNDAQMPLTSKGTPLLGVITITPPHASQAKQDRIIIGFVGTPSQCSRSIKCASRKHTHARKESFNFL